MKTSTARFSTILLFVLVIVELAVTMPSHKDCGTVAIDMMLCGYIDRLGWNLRNGSWLPLFIVWLLASIFFFVNQNHRMKSR